MTAPLGDSIAVGATTSKRPRGLAKLVVLDQPWFSDWSRPRQLWESVGGALVAGALCGVGVSVALWFYILGVVISVLGGLGTGAQHRTLRGAVARAFVAGAVWALGVIDTHQLIGNTAVIPLGHPSVLYLPWGIVPSVVVTTIMFFVARRVRASHTAA